MARAQYNKPLPDFQLIADLIKGCKAALSHWAMSCTCLPTVNQQARLDGNKKGCKGRGSLSQGLTSHFSSSSVAGVDHV